VGEGQETFELNFSSVSVPGDAHTEGLYTFKETIEDLSDGRITVEIHHSGSLYGQGSDEQAVMRGNLEMTYTSAAIAAEHLPEASMFNAGYTFLDYEHMTEVLNGEIGAELFDRVAEAAGYRPLGAFYLGSRQLNYRDIGQEVRTPEDLDGVLLRMPDAPAWLFLGEALGANPTPLDFGELYTALNTGTVDAQDNPLPTIKNANFYEVTDYVTLTYHVVDSAWHSINEELWNQMDDELQSMMYEAIEEARKQVDETNLAAEDELIDFLEEEGLTVIEPDMDAFITQVQAAYLENESITTEWDMELYDQIQNMVE
jgi:TRAP-type transport system periplasmic protein